MSEPSAPGFEVSDLRRRPEFCDTVADRIWNAWWRASGHPLAHVAALVRASLAPSVGQAPIPTTFVAHVGSQFAGTAGVIGADLADRPNLTPWVAAVWVDPAFRLRGIAAALVDTAAGFALGTGAPRVHLCTIPANVGFYTKLGWTPLESEVGPRSVTIFCRDT